MRRALFPILILAALHLSLPGAAPACTLFAAVGQPAGGGALIAKTRDWKPDHQQHFALVSGAGGHAYFGLFAATGKKPRLTAGINDAGLVIVSATASSVPKAERGETHISNLMAKLLAACASVDAVLMKKELFAKRSAGHYLMADKTRAARVEIGPAGQVSVKTVSDGVLDQTNHYQAPELAFANTARVDSSQARAKRIGELLGARQAPFTLDDFVAMSCDARDGPDNGIWRSGGTPEATRSLAAFIARLPASGPPTLFLRLANPGKPEHRATLTLDASFWDVRANQTLMRRLFPE